MPKLIILGSSNAIASENHENTHMVVTGKERTLLIDCVSTPAVRLRRAGVRLDQVTDIIITHFHPDHVSGVPLLLMDMWLLGRDRPLDMYGLDHTLDRIEKLMGFYEWEKWPKFFPVSLHRLPEKRMTPVLQCEEWRIFSSPVRHLIPAIGLRIEFTQANRVLAYSSDTEPCPQMVELASGADVLFHESTGPSRGHSSASQAGDIAQEAGVKSLYLIHYPTWNSAPESLVPLAAKTFGGPVALANDFMEFDF